jgi:high affinity sulfate transporter 1
VERLVSKLPPWLAGYRRDNLGADVRAALIVTALMVPQSLGYAAIANVPVQLGLYAIPGALIAYALFGSSRQLIVGPVSTVSVVSGSIIAVEAAGDQQQAVAFTIVMAIMSGVVLIAAGLLRAGWVAEFLSKPIISGFVFGLSVVIILGEVPTLLGIPPVSGAVPGRVVGIVRGIGDADLVTLTIGAVCLLVLFAGGWRWPRVPWGLMLVVAGILTARFGELGGRGVVLVGDVPRGLPVPGIPSVPISQLPALVFSGAALALVGLAESLSAARLFAAQGGYYIDSNREFVATGASNVLAGLSGGLGVAGSLSKTAAAVRSGGRTQMTGLIGAGVVLVTLVAFAPALGNLPRAVLSAIVVHAVWGLMDVEAIRRFARIRRNDLNAALGALIGVLVLGTLYGLLAAIAISVIGLLYRSTRVEVEEVGRIKGEKAAWGSVDRHPERRTIPGVLILRLTAPVYWVNAANVEEKILGFVAKRPDTRAVIIDLEATNQLDATSADTIGSLVSRRRGDEIEVHLVRVMHRARGVLRRTGILADIGEHHLWHTISQGVRMVRQSLEIEGWNPPDADHAEDPEPSDDAPEDTDIGTP